MSVNKLDEDKKSAFKIIFAIMHEIFLLIFPVVKVFSLNSLLSRAKAIQIDKENVKWFKNQGIYNYFWGILFTLPFFLGLFWAEKILVKDYAMMDRISSIEKTSGVINKVKKAYYVYNIDHEQDTKEEKRRKIYTQTNITAIGLILIVFTGIQFLFSAAFVHLHPLLIDSKELRRYLIQNGILREEDTDKIVLATPLGCLIDIAGTSKSEVERLDRLWSALNIKVKGSLEDKKKRSIVFFLKQYELRDKYLYEKLK